MAIYEILFSNDKVAAVQIAGDLYLIRLDPLLPEVFDHNLNKLVVHNIETWLSNITMLQVNYRSLIIQCLAFHKGFTASRYNKDRLSCIRDIVKLTVTNIFRSGLASKYVSDYWIECTPRGRLPIKIIAPIMKKSNYLIEKLGRRTFEDYANRIRKIVEENNDTTIDKMFKKLDLETREPAYPNTDALDNTVIYNVLAQYKTDDVPLDIMRLISECEKRLL